MPVSRVKPFWKLFKAKSCTLSLKSNDKEEVLKEIVGVLVAAGSVSPSLAPLVEQALLEREQLGSTGVGQNVAIPHVKIAGLEEAVACLCVHAEGVEWAAVDGEPVRVLFTVLRPDESTDLHDPERHLEMMRWISALARNEDFRNFAMQSKTRTELLALLKEMA